MNNIILRLFLFFTFSLVVFAEQKPLNLIADDDLSLWENPYEWGKVSKLGDEVHLSTDKAKFFLVTKKTYKDFSFTAEIMLPEGKANSGILFRCNKAKNKAWGYQAECDPSERAWSGGLYDEGRRGWMHPDRDFHVGDDEHYRKNVSPGWSDERKAVFQAGEWNRYKIQCIGPEIKIWLNDVLTTHVFDSKDLEGYIAIQHHGEKNQTYKFRNITIKEVHEGPLRSVFKAPPAPVLPIDDALNSFSLQEGFVMEEVASEPLVTNPVVIQFDAAGRMWVVEMNSYMPDVDGTNEEVPNSQIAVLEDTDADGKMDKRRVILDDVLLPRALAFVPGGILYADNTQLYFAEILPDLKLGKREVVDADYAKGGNVEHKPNALLYGLDNWYYSAKCDKAYRVIAPDAAAPAGASKIYANDYFQLCRKKTEFRGQWGLSMDDYGRLYHNGNSSPVMGEYLRPGSTMRNPAYQPKVKAFAIGPHEIYSGRINNGVNRAYFENYLREPMGQLRKLTAASGSLIYRGNQFPEKYANTALIPEPAANLISAREMIEGDGRLSGKPLYPKQEWLISSDERFRPVSLSNAPDGSVYVVDFYHGIIQHKTYLTDYLKRHIHFRDLDKGNKETGRIYRIKSTGKEVKAGKSLAGLSAKELVPYLADDNSWHRDTARQLIVQKNDRSVRDDLHTLCAKGEQDVAVINALWVLQGLDLVSLDAIKNAYKRVSPKIKVTALAVGEFLPEEQKDAFNAFVLEQVAQAGYEESLQMALLANLFSDDEALSLLKPIWERYGKNGFVKECILSGLPMPVGEFVEATKNWAEVETLHSFVKKSTKKAKPKKVKLAKEDEELFKRGKELFSGVAGCFGCHGADGKGLAGLAPPIINNEWVNDEKRFISILLHGLYGPIEAAGKKYNLPAAMPGLAANPGITDKDIASIATYVRNSFGNKKPSVSEEAVSKLRAATKDRAAPYSQQDFK